MNNSGMITIIDKARNETLHISSINPRSLRSIAGNLKEKLTKDGISHAAY
jgi:hypothetical protein